LFLQELLARYYASEKRRKSREARNKRVHKKRFSDPESLPARPASVSSEADLQKLITVLAVRAGVNPNGAHPAKLKRAYREIKKRIDGYREQHGLPPLDQVRTEQKADVESRNYRRVIAEVAQRAPVPRQKRKSPRAPFSSWRTAQQ
jgi:hypothetical protein